MALFKPYKILSSQLSSLPIKEGQFIITTDTNKVYIDIDNSTREEYGKSGSKTYLSETEPSDMNEGDLWMVVESSN